MELNFLARCSWYPRKSSLEVYQVYLKLAEYGLVRINNKQEIVIHAKLSQNCRVKFVRLSTHL